ncbi:MAG: hypothetical protein HQ463_07160 [Bacteroidetes bacterium]|nr:hypothetical protein [Bacteroidota bacterium]
MNKKLIFKTAFLLIITTACTFKAKAQLTLNVTNGSGCSTLIEILDNSSNVIYSVTNSASQLYTCVGTSSATPVEIRYSAGGYIVVIPVGANNHPTNATTGCLIGVSVTSYRNTSGSCLPPGTNNYVDITLL